MIFKLIKRKAGVIWVSAVLYLLISVLIMVLVLHIGVPVINKMKDRSILMKQTDTFGSIDEVINDVAYEGPGSRREIPLQIDKGEILVNEGRFAWTMQTEDKFIEPGTIINVGDVTVTTATDVTATEYNDSYILMNSEVIINLTKCENSNDCAFIDNIIHNAYLRVTDEPITELDAFDFYIDNVTMFEGEGYSQLSPHGEYLDHAKVIYHLLDPPIALELTLKSYVDYLEIRLVEE